MLRACGKRLRPGGRLAFWVIHPAPALSDASYRAALAAGPRAVSTRRRSYTALLAAAGFEGVEATDLTAELRETTRQLLDHRQRHARELVSIWGEAALAEELQEDRHLLAAIDEGLLRRSLFLAHVAPRSPRADRRRL